MSLALFSPLKIEDRERTVLIAFAVGALLVGLVSSFFLAQRLDDRETISTDYWDNLLKIVGVAALPIVAMAVLVVRSAMNMRRPLGGWGVLLVIGAMGAFAVTMVVILICLFQIVVAADTAEGQVPAAPDAWVIWLATLGAGATLGAAAVGVAAAALDKIDDPDTTP